MKKNNLYLFVLGCFLFPSITFASNYNVENYEIDIDISDNQVYTYNESIKVTFNDRNVDVTKELPSNIKEFETDSEYLMETKNTKLITFNSKSYSNDVYSLTYKIENKSLKKDLYEIDLLNSYNNNLNNITFYITLPEDFSKNNIEFYLNNKKIKDIDYKIVDTTIQGTYKKLNENDTLTLKIDYNKVYFSTSTILATIIPIILALLSGLLWYFFGKDLNSKVTKKDSLPKNINPIELAMIYNGQATEKDAFNLLIYLANKGYIKIEETNSNEFTIKKDDDYNGKNYKETTFIKALFKKNSNLTLTEYLTVMSEKKTKKTQTTENDYDKEISKENLYSRFQRAKENVLPLVNSLEEKSKYFEKTAEIQRAYLLMMIATILIILTSVPFIDINKLYLLPVSVIFSIVTLHLLMNFADNYDPKINKKKLWLFVIGAVVILTIMLFPSFKRNKIYIITFIINLICIGLVLFFYKFMPKRTIAGTRQYSNILGYKQYINELTDEELTNNLKENNNYLYDLLPYADCLSLEEKVLKMMKDKEVSGPSWYKLKDEYTVQKFSNSLSRLYNTLKNKDTE